MTKFQGLIGKLRRRGFPVARIAAKCDTSESALWALYKGRSREPGWSLGQRLIAFEKRTRPKRKRAGQIQEGGV